MKYYDKKTSGSEIVRVFSRVLLHPQTLARLIERITLS